MPVTTPSNKPSTQRIPSTRSSAATKCISDVPGLAKHTLTPPPTIVRTRLSAPFIPVLRSLDPCCILPGGTGGGKAGVPAGALGGIEGLFILTYRGVQRAQAPGYPE